MIKITKARRNGIISSLIILPLFLGLSIWAAFAGNWWAAIGILVSWGFFFLFATSWLFQALVIFLAAVYAFSQKNWLVGIGGLLLTAYLYRVSKFTDQDMVDLPERLNTISPTMGRLFELVDNPRKRSILILGVLGISIVVVVIAFLLLK